MKTIPVPRAGELNRRLTLLKRSLRTNQDEQVEQFEELETVWAQLIPWTARDWYGADQPHNEQTIIFVIRYRTDLNPKDRVRYLGRDFNLVNIAELGVRQALELVGIEAPH